MVQKRQPSVGNQAYDIIKDRIISGDYPPESMLNEVALSEELGISRTPIREALSKLESEMLVTIFPKRGTLVAPINLNVVNDIFQTRKLLEPFIIENYGPLIDTERLHRAFSVQMDIQTSQSKMNFHYLADQDLHQIIIDANTNIYITEMLSKVYWHNQRIRILTGSKSKNRLMKSCEEHLAIIDCLLCKDYLAASQKMRDHLSASWLTTVQILLESSGNARRLP